ncbi:hypothetical protein JCM10296v2_002768 [Rhodotorula toruloides]
MGSSNAETWTKTFSPWALLYYGDIVHHLDDMRDDLRRIQSRRDALQQQHSLAKSEFVPVGRRSGMVF